MQNSANIDLIQWTETFSQAPDLEIAWNEKQNSKYEKLKEFVFGNDEFNDFYNKEIKNRIKKASERKEAGLAELTKLNEKLKPLIAKKFGTKKGIEIASLSSSIEKFVSASSETKELETQFSNFLLQTQNIFRISIGKVKALNGLTILKS